MGIYDLETLDVGQANELKLAFRKHGFNNRDLKRLVEGDRLAEVLNYLKGFSAIRPIRGPNINCDIWPRIPEGMSAIEIHWKAGVISWNPGAFRLVYPRSESDRDLTGKTIRKELHVDRPANACVLDFLLANPDLIPDEWFHPHGEFGRLWVAFYGTIFRDTNDKQWVPYLHEDKRLIQYNLMPLDHFMPRSFSRALLLPRQS
jgi:hypothetical protein